MLTAELVAVTPLHSRRRLILTVLAHEMDNEIRLCQSALVCAPWERALVDTLHLLLVLGLLVKFQSRGVEKSLLTDGTLIGKLSLMSLQMIVHRVLLRRSLAAVAADVKAISVLLVLVDHSWIVTRGTNPTASIFSEGSPTP